MISIVVPSTEGADAQRLINNFYANEKKLEFPVQFVVLLNTKKKYSAIEEFNRRSAEVLVVENDRFFSSCEENMFRIENVFRLLGEFIFFVGAHDQINWVGVNSVVKNCMAQAVDVCGWNITNLYEKCGSELLGAPEISMGLKAESHLINLRNNVVIDSRIAVASLVSVYGPIDWFAYLGNHIFRKHALRNILSHSFDEYVWSFAFKIIIELTQKQYRYAFESKPVITRLADISAANWIPSHRHERGCSPKFFLALLYYINRLDGGLFHLIVCSQQLAQKGPKHVQLSFFINLIAHLSTFIRGYENQTAFGTTVKSAETLRDFRQCKIFIAKLIEFGSQIHFEENFGRNAWLALNRLNLALSKEDMTQFFDYKKASQAVTQLTQFMQKASTKKSVELTDYVSTRFINNIH